MTKTQELTLAVAADELKRIEDMAQMVMDREWAEHAGKGPISNKVESAFTQLHNELGVAQSQLSDTHLALKSAKEEIAMLREQLKRFQHQFPGA